MRLYDLAVKLLESDNYGYNIVLTAYHTSDNYYVEVSKIEGPGYLCESINRSEAEKLKKLNDEYYKRKAERDKNKFKSQIMKDLGLTNE